MPDAAARQLAYGHGHGHAYGLSEDLAPNLCFAPPICCMRVGLRYARTVFLQLFAITHTRILEALGPLARY